MGLVGVILIVLAILLIIDSVLAIIIGKKYMFWGLEYTPESYRLLIRRISEYPPAKLMGIKLAEGIIGLILIWIVKAFL